MNSKISPNGVAPSLTRYRVGGKGGLVAQAWQYVWDRLSATEYRDAVALADQAARVFKILPASVRAHMYAATREGQLETEVREVVTQVTRYDKTFDARRKRTFYRIAQPPRGDQ